MVRGSILGILSVAFLTSCNPLGESKTQGSFGACGNVSWTEFGAAHFQNILSCIQATASEGGASAPKFSKITFTNTAQQQWSGSILAPNGNIYGLPFGSPAGRDPASVLIINPSSGSVTTLSFANPTKTSWASGVLAPNGKIYGFPNAQADNNGNNVAPTKILVIDPTTSQVSTVDFLNPNNHFWTGSAVGGNGKIFTVSSDTNSANGNIMIFDPKSNTAVLKDFPKGQANNKWGGVVLGADGNIFGFPSNTNNYADAQVIRINVITEETFLIDTSDAVANMNQWAGGVMGVNGKHYTIDTSGYDKGQILLLDTSISQTDSVAYTNTVGYRWKGGVLAPNGKIYGIPSGQQGTVKSLVLDTTTNKATFSADIDNSTGEAWAGATLAGDGKIYCVPNTGSTTATVLVIDPQANRNFSFNTLLTPYLNRF